MMLKILLSLFVVIAPLTKSLAQEKIDWDALAAQHGGVLSDQVKIGNATIALTVPRDPDTPDKVAYYRIDGKNPKIDPVLQASVGKDSRLLAWYGTQAALTATLAGTMPPDSGISLCAMIPRVGERVEITPQKFEEFKNESISNRAATIEGVDPKKIGQVSDEAMRLLGAKISNAKIGQPISLGVFDQGPNHVSYSMVMKVESGGTSQVLTISQSALLIKNHVILLNGTLAYHGAVDLERLQNTLRDWSDWVVRANK